MLLKESPFRTPVLTSVLIVVGLTGMTDEARFNIGAVTVPGNLRNLRSAPGRASTAMILRPPMLRFARYILRSNPSMLDAGLFRYLPAHMQICARAKRLKPRNV